MVRIGEKGDVRCIWFVDEDSAIALARTRLIGRSECGSAYRLNNKNKFPDSNKSSGIPAEGLLEPGY